MTIAQQFKLESRQEVNRALARKLLLKKKMSAEEVAELTELALNEVRQLQESITKH